MASTDAAHFLSVTPIILSKAFERASLSGRFFVLLIPPTLVALHSMYLLLSSIICVLILVSFRPP